MSPISSFEAACGAPSALKPAVDEALLKCPDVRSVLVVRRTGQEVEWDQDRDVWWHDLVGRQSAEHECEFFDAEHPLFVMYTSGTTGKPKGILHTSGGYLTQVAYSHHAVFDLKPHGPSRIPAIVPVEEITLPTIIALGTACERSSDVTAVHVNYDTEDGDLLIKRWPSQFPDIRLVVIESPYRTVAEPLSWYITDRIKQFPNEATIILPSIRVRHWWQRPMVNQSLRRLRTVLGRRKTVTFVENPFAVR